MTTDTVTRTDLVGQAAAVVPLLRSHAAWSEEHRRLHDEVVEAMADAGVYRMRIPARFGGLESDSRTVIDVLSTLAGGDGSAAWNAAVWSISNWLASLLPDLAQDEIFTSPDTRVCGVLSPTATAEPAPGGLVVDGAWHFVSGAWHSQWQMIIAMGPAPDGTRWPVMAAVPMSDLRIVDDWHTAGLRGTGSITTVAERVFVPQHRILPMVAILNEQYASEHNAGSPMYRQPMMATGCSTFVGPAIGLARAAQAAFLERLPGRKITYTSYTSQAEAPLTHLQVAEASLQIDEAEFHANRVAGLIEDKNATREPWTMADRVLARASLGRVFDLTRQAVGVLRTASGGSSVYLDNPIQRIERDVQTLHQHALMHPNTNLELYGRILCGQEPNTLYL